MIVGDGFVIHVELELCSVREFVKMLFCLNNKDVVLEGWSLMMVVL